MAFFSLALIAGIFNGSSNPIDSIVLLVAFTSFSLLWMSCYFLNDLCDTESDRLNNLDRPLTRGRATELHYRFAFVILSLLGILVSLMLPFTSALCLIVCWLLGIGYSLPSIRMKRIPVLSLFPSAASFSLLVICGSFLRGEMTHTSLFLSIVMFFLVFLAGNAKDLGDINGDSAMGGTTLPMLIGSKATAWLTLLTSVAIGTVVILSFFFLPLELCFPIFSSLGVSVLVLGGIMLVRKEDFAPVEVRRVNTLQSLGAILILVGYLMGSFV